MNIEKRLGRLESEQAGDGGVIVVPVPAGMSKDEVLRQRFGNEAPPENALIVLIRRFSEDAG